jgi:hypothetical protein
MAIAIAGCSSNDANKVTYYGKFHELPINEIQPRGWARQYLENQRDGLTGHLENAGYPFNTEGWAADSITGNHSVEKWWPYEQNAYWVDGMIRAGHLLGDTFLINKALRSINYVLDHPDSTGFLGPVFTKPNYERDRWIHVVFFRALMAHYSATADKRIAEALKKHYLGDKFPHTGTRESINTEIILWVYEQTGDTALLHFAEEVYKNSNFANASSAVSDVSFLKDTMMFEHGVTYNEKAKLGAILYLYTGNENFLRPSVAAMAKLDKYNMLISGVNVSSEHLDFVNSREMHEVCDIADFTLAAGYLLMATGNASYADKIERAIFNAAPGAVTENFRALQYFSAPNQVLACKGASYRDGGNQLRFAPNPGTECCPGNVNRIMPNFIARAWMRDERNGLAATFYVPSVVKAKVGETKQPVTIEETTSYPFNDTITFRFALEKTVEFPFHLRIPAWCKEPRVYVNNQLMPGQQQPGSYFTISRTFCNNDVVKVVLTPGLSITPGPEGGISVERGPLVYSLLIKENWQRDLTDTRSNDSFPAWHLSAASPWNYALCIDSASLVSTVRVLTKTPGTTPWSIHAAPIELKVPAREIEGWDLVSTNRMMFEKWDVERDSRGKVSRWFKIGETWQNGNWKFTPPLPDKKYINSHLSPEPDTVTLVPYGCTKLRVTVFPRVMVK